MPFQKTFRKPLLTGALATAAQEAVEAVLTGLKGRYTGRPREGESVVSPLAGGPAGMALLFGYAHLAFPERGFDDVCLEAIQTALATVAGFNLGPSLFSGFTGVGWMLSHLEERIFEAEDDPGAEVESALLEALAVNGEVWPAELIGGLAGFGLYFLERLPRETARRGVERTVELLAACATEDESGITWFTAAAGVPPSQRELAPHGYYNLGVSHGIGGVIGFLAAALSAGVGGGEARRLLAGAVSWLLAQRLPAGGASLFPAYVGPGIQRIPTRHAWCYGDLGLAAALLKAARSLGREDWEEEALAVARLAALRRDGDHEIVDAGLCHGAAGAGHVFHRLYRATGDETLREAALYWLDRALAMHRPERGYGGFLRAEAGPEGETVWQEEPAFLTGSAGAGLALLAALSTVEPEWDRVMLLS
ncbi:MAG TPA: lanthionine synthetase LanC family protein [Thermoanaerobaculia bacterium]|nr:lanthionine synthetase LanC family protein [Thermoanaerobaculia bacterium]